MNAGRRTNPVLDAILDPVGVPLYAMVGGLLIAFCARAFGPDASVIRIGTIIACLSFSLCCIGLARISGWGDRSFTNIATNGIFLFGAVTIACMALRLGIADDAWILAHVMRTGA